MSYQGTKARRKKATRGRFWGSGRKVFALNLALLCLVGGLLAGYLVMNNQSAASGFAVRDLEKQISTLRDEADDLDLQIVAMQAMNNVEQQIGGLGFVPIEQLDYISGAPAIVAVK